MHDSFNRCYNPNIGDDKKNFPLHAAHPSLSANPGRSAEQSTKETNQALNRPLINPKTGGRR